MNHYPPEWPTRKVRAFKPRATSNARIKANPRPRRHRHVSTLASKIFSVECMKVLPNGIGAMGTLMQRRTWCTIC